MVLRKTDFPFAPLPYRRNQICSRVLPVRLYPTAFCRYLTSSSSPPMISWMNFSQRGHSAFGSYATGAILVSRSSRRWGSSRCSRRSIVPFSTRSEEHTSELQSRENLVCRLLREKQNILNHIGVWSELLVA